jgi:hypothetical protein
MTWRCALRALGFALVGGFAAPATLGCARRAPPSAQRGKTVNVPLPSVSKRAAVPAEESAAGMACARVLARLEAEPALPGARVNSGFERAFLLGRARAEPVLFWRAPAFDPARGSAQARALRAELSADEHPAFAFEQVLAKVKKSPELAREVS